MEKPYQQQKEVVMSDIEFYTIISALDFFSVNCCDYEASKMAEAVRNRLNSVQFCMGNSTTLKKVEDN